MANEKTLGVATNKAQIELGTISGITKLETASGATVGFFGVTAIAQPSGAGGAALTLTTATTSGFGFATSAAFNAFTAQLEELRATLVELGLHAGS